MVSWIQAFRSARALLGLGACLGAGAQGLDQETEEQMALKALQELRNVRVSIASRMEQTMRDAPAVVSIVRREEIRIQGWQRLSEVLDQVPGFSTRWQAGGDQGLVVRGMFAADGVLVQVDGVSINDPLNGNVAFYDFPLEGIERIEIARGPGSALYGGYAFLAVINLISASKAAPRTETEAQIGGGRPTSFHVQGEHEGLLPFGFAKVYAGLHRNRDRRVRVQDDLITSLIRRTTVGDRAYDRYQAIASDDDERFFQARQWEGGAHLQVTEGPLAGLSVDGLYVQKRTLPFLSRLYALVDQGLLERRDDLSRWSAAWPLNPSPSIQLTPRIYTTSIYGRSAGQITRPYGWDDDEDFDGITERWPGGRVEARSYLFHTLGGELVSSFGGLGPHALSAGFVLERTWLARTQYFTNSSRLSSGVEVSFANDQVVNAQEWDPKQNRQDSWIYTGIDGQRIVQDIRRNLGAVFVQDLWKVRPDLSATLGLRFDHFSGFGSAVSPRAALVWNLDERIYVKGLYGQAFKPPTFQALYDGTVTLKNERQIYGNPDLKIATIRTGEVAFGFQATPALLVQANVFLTRTRDEVVFNAQFEQYRNEASRRTEGLELELQGNWSTRRFHLSYAYNRAKEGEGSGAPLYPQHQLNLGGEARGLFSRVDLGSTLSWRSAQRREAGDLRPPLPSTALLQAQITVHISRSASLALGGSNLLDRDWRSPVDRALAGVLPGDVPREGRTVEARMEIRF